MDDALTVDVVLERFAAAEDLLGRAAETLSSLGNARETTAETAASLTSSSEALAAAARQLGDLVEALASSKAAMVSALEAAKQFLGDTDLSGLQKSVKAVDKRTTQVESTVADLAESVRLIDESLSGKIAQLGNSVDRSAQLQRERDLAVSRYEALMSQLPDKILKKVRDLPV
jgi:hypothetical protein